MDKQRLDDLKKVYKKYYFPEINLEPLKENLKIGERSPKYIQNKLDDAEELGKYFLSRIQLEYAKKGLDVVDAPTEDSFIWELAIVELDATGVAVNAAATVAGIFVPGSGLVKRFATGSIAIEGIIRDGKTGDILAEFKDREADKETVLSARDFQKYSHARYTLDEWAEQFAQLSSTTSDVKVEDSLPVTINPF
ncbi:MAG: DUF3313 family protein [Proteobacteria bacterium]|nr:DUF3313 family protein [Pseudomonadota bacterium]